MKKQGKTAKKPAQAAPPEPVDLETEVVKVMGEVLSRRPESIDRTMPLKELVEDSYDLVEMIMALKDHFEVAVVASEMEGVATVTDLVAYLKGKGARVE